MCAGALGAPSLLSPLSSRSSPPPAPPVAGVPPAGSVRYYSKAHWGLSLNRDTGVLRGFLSPLRAETRDVGEEAVSSTQLLREQGTRLEPEVQGGMCSSEGALC